MFRFETKEAFVPSAAHYNHILWLGKTECGKQAMIRPGKTKRRVFFCAVCMPICVVVASLTVLFVLFTHTPGNYRPVQASGSEEVSTYLTHELATGFHNGIDACEPFEIIVRQDKLNQLIVDGTSLGWSWPITLHSITFHAPVIQITPTDLTLMGKVDLGIPIIVTLVGRPRLTDKGFLELNLEKVKAGAVNITGLARNIGGSIMAAEVANLAQDQWLKDLSDAFIHNAPYDPVFPVPPYEVYIRLTRVESYDQRMILRFEPAGKMK
ncbi:MAG: hypothetical protein JW828_03880 [Sedimentisphaerales bacterium]|nr:hypothetical protein [Sedimentisphaerales bacterium]